MSHPQSHKQICLNLDMHGLTLEASIWPLAGSTRFWFQKVFPPDKEPSVTWKIIQRTYGQKTKRHLENYPEDETYGQKTKRHLENYPEDEALLLVHCIIQNSCGTALNFSETIYSIHLIQLTIRFLFLNHSIHNLQKCKIMT